MLLTKLRKEPNAKMAQQHVIQQELVLTAELVVQMVDVLLILERVARIKRSIAH
jgi:hypothetical protein